MYFNRTTQIVTAAAAATSFTTDIPFNNFDSGAFQVIWSGADGVAGTFRLQATIDGSNFSNMTANASTMTTANSSFLYNITDGGYQAVRCVYVAATNTTGTVDVWFTAKSRR